MKVEGIIMIKMELINVIMYNYNKVENKIKELEVEIELLFDFIKVFENDLNDLYKKNNIRLYFRGEKELYDELCMLILFRKKKMDFKKFLEDEIYY